MSSEAISEAWEAEECEFTVSWWLLFRVVRVRESSVYWGVSRDFFSSRWFFA